MKKTTARRLSTGACLGVSASLVSLVSFSLMASPPGARHYTVDCRPMGVVALEGAATQPANLSPKSPQTSTLTMEPLVNYSVPFVRPAHPVSPVAAPSLPVVAAAVAVPASRPDATPDAIAVITPVKTPVALMPAGVKPVAALKKLPPPHLTLSISEVAAREADFKMTLNAPPSGVMGSYDVMPSNPMLKWSPQAAGHLDRDLAPMTQLFDFDSIDSPTMATDLAQLVIPLSTVQPILSIAHQTDDLDRNSRVGLGGGARWNIRKNAGLASHLILFPPGDKGLSGLGDIGGSSTEVQFLTRLEIKF